MGKHWIKFMLALILVLSIAAGQEDESPEVKFRAAMHRELMEGDLSGAIELYQKVVSDPNADRATVAKALLQIGLCYEKLGDAQARPAYQKLIDGYPEQRREVEAARQRLAEMEKMSAEVDGMPTFRHIQMTARLYGPAALSPQGDHLAFAADGSIWLVPVHGEVHPEIAGVPERLTEPMGAWGQLAWSRDGNWIAFNANNSDIYIVPSAGDEPTRIIADRFPGGGRSPWDYAISLSPDGTKLACAAGLEGQDSVYLVQVADREAAPLPVDQSRQPAFSPDGRWIAFVTESRTDKIEDGELMSTFRGTLWVASSNGENAVPLIEIPGRVRSPVWSPDGRMIAYLHDDGINEFTRELRIIQIREDGRLAAASGELEMPFATRELLAGWTTRDEIGILKFVPGSSSIYRVAVMGGRAAMIRAYYGDHPRWSPDGSRIYFRHQGEIFYMASEGGESINVPSQTVEVISAVPGGSNEPSPDGSRIVLAGYLKKPGRVSVNIWTIPSDGGVPHQITGGLQSPAEDRFPCWSPDGRVIAFVKVGLGEGPGIYLAAAQGGDTRRVTSAEDRVAWAPLAWSPNGTDIAYFSTDTTIRLFDFGTGDSRILVDLQKYPGQQPSEPGNMPHNEMAWSPDGRQLAYTYNGIIWLVPLDNPQPIRLETGRAELRATHLDWSPDGKWLVFKGDTGYDLQLHLMTDFMPLVTR